MDRIIEVFLAFTTEEGSRQLLWAAVGGAGREFELRGGICEQGKPPRSQRLCAE